MEGGREDLMKLNHWFVTSKKTGNCVVCNSKVSKGLNCSGCKKLVHEECLDKIEEECPNPISDKKKKTQQNKTTPGRLGGVFKKGGNEKISINEDKFFKPTQAKRLIANNQQISGNNANISSNNDNNNNSNNNSNNSNVNSESKKRFSIFSKKKMQSSNSNNDSDKSIPETNILSSDYTKDKNENIKTKMSLTCGISGDPTEVADESSLQIVLENSLMDAMRFEQRAMLIGLDIQLLQDECKVLLDRKKELFQTTNELMNKQLDLLCLLDETNQERDSISDQLIDLSQALEEAFSRLVPFVHSYLNRLEAKYLSLPDKSKKYIDKMTEPILVSTSIDHSQITSSQINAIRSNIRRLEKQFQFKNLFKIEQINLEKDINFISLINSSFQSLLRLGNDILHSDKNTMELEKSTTKTLEEVIQKFDELSQKFEEGKSVSGSQVEKSALALLDTIDLLSSKIVNSDQQYETWNADLFSDKSEIQFTNVGNYLQVTAATIPKLIELLTYEAYPDTLYTKAFLLTYRSFITPTELLERLILRYCLSPPDSISDEEEIYQIKKKRQVPIRLRVLNVLKYWVEHHYEIDFRDPKVVELIEYFVRNTVTRTGHKSFADYIMNLFERKKQKNSGEKKIQYPSPPLPPEIPPVIDFDSLSPSELARQMTLMDEITYKKLTPTEFLNNNWAKANKLILSPNICEITARFNSISNWISTEILTKNSPELRAKTLSKFLEILKNLQKLNNYAGQFAVASGLNSYAIHRMKLTWNQLTTEQITPFTETNHLMEKSFKNYREALVTVNPPCIPYLGLWQTDLTFLSDGNPDRVEGNLINFKKMRKVADTLLLIQQFQNDVYCFLPANEIQEFILTKYQSAISEDDAFNMSVQLEPRELVANI